MGSSPADKPHLNFKSCFKGADLCQVYSPGGSELAQMHFRMCQTLFEHNATGMSPDTVWFNSKRSENPPRFEPVDNLLMSLI